MTTSRPTSRLIFEVRKPWTFWFINQFWEQNLNYKTKPEKFKNNFHINLYLTIFLFLPLFKMILEKNQLVEGFRWQTVSYLCLENACYRKGLFASRWSRSDREQSCEKLIQPRRKFSAWLKQFEVFVEFVFFRSRFRRKKPRNPTFHVSWGVFRWSDIADVFPPARPISFAQTLHFAMALSTLIKYFQTHDVFFEADIFTLRMVVCPSKLKTSYKIWKSTSR